MKIQAEYRWMEAADTPAVGLLAKRIWNAHYPSIISQEQIDFMLEDRYAPEHLLKQLHEGQHFLLAEQEGEVLGFLSYSPLKHVLNTTLRGYDYGEGACFLHKFYLASECHGKGLGSAMLGELHRRIPEIRLLRLQVNRRNEQAWRFYQKQGFEIIAEADFEIGGGFLMEDFVMEKQFA